MRKKKQAKKLYFRKEFENRLIHLFVEIDNYLRTGNVYGVLPALFKCFSFCWCSTPYVKRKPINRFDNLGIKPEKVKFTDEFKQLCKN